jgi:hypothetical protein
MACDSGEHAARATRRLSIVATRRRPWGRRLTLSATTVVALAAVANAAACGARTELTSEEIGSGSGHTESRAAGSGDPEAGSADVVDAAADRTGDGPPPDAPGDTCAADASCPVGFELVSCGDCVASSFAVTGTDLYGLNLPAGTVELIGGTGGHMLTDIAIDEDGNLFGVSDKFLYSLDPSSGTPTLIGPVANYPLALGFGPYGTLYSAGSNTSAVNVIFTIDPATGAETPLAPFPLGYQVSGDVAVIGRTLYATAAGGSEDELAVLDLDTLAGNILGPIGFGCVYGLAAHAGELYGFTCAGQIIQIDPTTAVGTLVSTPGESFAGAATR